MASNTLLPFVRIIPSWIYSAYSDFIRHCPFHYNMLNDIEGHSTSSRNRNRENRGNFKSRQRVPSAIEDQTLFSTAWSEPYRMSDSSCARHRACSSTFIVSESLFPIRSHGEYYLIVPLRVLAESTSRVSPTHYPWWHSCKSYLSRLLANLSWLIRKSAGDRPSPRRLRNWTPIWENASLSFLTSFLAWAWESLSFWAALLSKTKKWILSFLMRQHLEGRSLQCHSDPL